MARRSASPRPTVNRWFSSLGEVDDGEAGASERLGYVGLGDVKPESRRDSAT